MERSWKIRKHDQQEARKLASTLGVSPLTAALLIARGFNEPDAANRFFEPSFDHLHDPFELKDMDGAVDRVMRAIKAGESIMIWGDYDVDGTTGTAVLRDLIRKMGGKSSFHIPNRFSEGYGVNIPALKTAKSSGASLVITVDCGIRSFEPLEWAADAGLDIIVTDHHLSDESRGNPPAIAIVNPNQFGCDYPNKNLAGVGVAFKLAHAIAIRSGREDIVPTFLNITAIGTIADMMDLSVENRAIVSLGLKDLKNTKNLGLRTLMEVAGCGQEMSTSDIGFRIAPRINAAGRMDAARYVVDLFETESRSEADRLARMLDDRNRERQEIQQRITEFAMLECEGLSEDNFVVVAGQGWHKGVVGLAASRIAERLYRPTIVLSIDGDLAQGSGRSVGGFNMVDALDKCRTLFLQYGGHAAAAGLTLRTENIGQLKEELNSIAAPANGNAEWIPILEIDARVSSATLGLEIVNELARFEPYGIGNRIPILMTSGLKIIGEPRVMKNKHLKLDLIDGAGKKFEAVWWDGVERSIGRTLRPGTGIEVAYKAAANHWQGQTRLQLVVEDIRTDNHFGG